MYMDRCRGMEEPLLLTKEAALPVTVPVFTLLLSLSLYGYYYIVKRVFASVSPKYPCKNV